MVSGNNSSQAPSTFNDLRVQMIFQVETSTDTIRWKMPNNVILIGLSFHLQPIGPIHSQKYPDSYRQVA